MHIALFQLVTICSLTPVLHLIFNAIPASSLYCSLFSALHCCTIVQQSALYSDCVVYHT